MKLTQAQIDAMPIEEKLELSEALWKSICSSPDELPVPDWHKELLDESLRRLETHPDDQRAWPEARAGLIKD